MRDTSSKDDAKVFLRIIHITRRARMAVDEFDGETSLSLPLGGLDEMGVHRRTVVSGPNTYALACGTSLV